MAGNKFWGGAGESESDSDSGSSDSEEERPAVAVAAPRKMARWAEASSSEDEGVAQRRVVRSHTDKKNEQMLEQIKVMKNHMKIDDFSSTITDYEALIKMLEKLRMQMEADGGPPKQFIKAIGALEDYIEKTHNDIQEKKTKGQKLPENKAKAFNTLRSKVKKGNKAYTDDLAQLRSSPDDFQSEEEQADSASEAAGGSAASESSSSSSSSDSRSSSSDSDSDSSSDTGDSDSDSDDGESFDSDKSGSEDGGDEDLIRERKMLRWLITPEKLAEREKKAEVAKAKEAENKAKDQEKRARKKDKTEDGPKGATHQRKGKDEPEEYTSKELTKKVTEIAQERGRRGFDRKSYMDKLQKLLVHAAKHGPLEQLYIKASQVSADFDNTGSAFAAMKIEMWNEALQKVNSMLPLLIESHNMKNNSSEDKASAGEADLEDPKSHGRLQDLFLSFVEKLDDELYKALQFNSDVYGSEYHEILGNSSKCLVLLNRTLRYFEEVQEVQHLGAIAARLMEQLYYKPDTLNARVFEAIPHTMPDESKAHWVWPDDSKAYMGKLCHYVWAAGDVRLRRRACLCQAYHLALHNCFQPARDLLHLGNFAEQATESDVHTQILYNRVIAQIGLCAFRLGKITEAHNCLMDVCQYNKGRELLAQGLSYAKGLERSQEQERAERQRQLPYHMHMNLEVLESAQHICAMLLEVPNMAMQAIDPSNKRLISRVLRRALETYDKQQYTGPPETAKDSVVAAAKDLQRGDWAKACAQLEGLQLWHHIDTNHPENGEKVKAMITEKMKVEALRTYLFSYASIYDAFHLDQLVEMFSLSADTVHSTISKMMIKEEITAFWDESSKFVLVQHVEPTALQRLAITLAERAVQAVENNERLVDLKSGGFAFKDGARAQPGLATAEKGKGRMGKGFDMKADMKGAKGKGRGKGAFGQPVRRTAGWENARAGALRGSQRGWSTGIRTT